MRKQIATVVALAVLLGAAGFALSGAWPWPRLSEQPAPTLEAQPPAIRLVTDTLQPGESLGELFGRHGIGNVDLMELVRLMEIDARRMRAGEIFQFDHVGADTTAFAVMLRTNLREQVRAVRADEGWIAERTAIRWDTHAVRVVGEIETSLYDALGAARADASLESGDRVRLAWDLADVFAWQVDFTTDLQPGDRFALVFEQEVSELGETRVGRVLAGEITVAGRPLEAFRFDNPDVRGGFYDAKGESLRRAFLRAPLEFRRMSSGFSRSRRHPILGTWRRHQGLDYAADTGTPVRASGDGRVAFLGWSGGYGRMVEVTHRNGITTRYAHLNGFGRGVQRGSFVAQGDIIGYVGSSGLANGPHLHYEFRQNGVARDPRQVNSSSGEPIPAALRPLFLAERDRLVAMLRPAPAADLDLAAGSD